MYRLEAAQTGDEITEIYDVHGANLSQSVLINLVLKSQFEAAGNPPGSAVDFETIAAEIDRVVSAYKADGSQTKAEMAAAIAALPSVLALSDAGDQLAQDLADHLIRHGDQFLQAQYSLVHTLILPERYYIGGGDFSYVFSNTHRVFTESQLRDAEDIPGDFSLPKSIINNNVSAEWLKQPAHSSMTLYQKRQIVTEYLSADTWVPFLYATAQ
jgi:hypothetical protein